MQKELYIWLTFKDPYIEVYGLNELNMTLEDTIEDLYNNKQRVDTVQTNVCSTTWLAKGYRIFVIMLNGEIVEIKLGSNNKNTDRKIRISHNLEKLLLANVFGEATKDYY